MPQDIAAGDAEERPRRSTGIAGLDFQLGGGFPEGTSVVIYGSPLTGSDRMAKQFWQADERESKYFMIDSFVEEGMIDVLSTKPEDLIQAMQGERIVVDSLSSIILEEGIDVALRLLTDGIRGVKDNGGNALFLMYDGLHTRMEEIRVMRAADVFITLLEEFHGNTIERKLIINKLLYTDVPSRIFPYNIMDFGLELSTTARVV
jgi:KaiC/GvpD/RAD55 family RecA-like ATPase